MGTDNKIYKSYERLCGRQGSHYIIYEVESNEKGMVSFDGLKYTVDGAAFGEAVKPNAGSKDYWIVETEAPTLLV